MCGYAFRILLDFSADRFNLQVPLPKKLLDIKQRGVVIL